MNEILIKDDKKIEDMIYEVKGMKVIMDEDVAMLFGYETKYLNRQIQINVNRFS